MNSCAILGSVGGHHPKDTVVEIDDGVPAGLHHRVEVARLRDAQVDLVELALGVDQEERPVPSPGRRIGTTTTLCEIAAAVGRAGAGAEGVAVGLLLGLSGEPLGEPEGLGLAGADGLAVGGADADDGAEGSTTGGLGAATGLEPERSSQTPTPTAAATSTTIPAMIKISRLREPKGPEPELPDPGG